MSNNRNTNLTNSHSFPIACVGASAGGLEALISLFKALPKNIDMAFVLILHLEPLHKSALSEIIGRETPLTICEAKNNTKIESGHVYVIPPRSALGTSYPGQTLWSSIVSSLIGGKFKTPSSILGNLSRNISTGALFSRFRFLRS